MVAIQTVNPNKERQAIMSLNKQLHAAQQVHNIRLGEYKDKAHNFMAICRRIKSITDSNDGNQVLSNLKMLQRKNEAKMEEARNRAITAFKEIMSIEERLLTVELLTGLSRKDYKIAS